MNGNPQYQEDTLALEEVSEDSLYTLWLLNDDVHTFDYVIDVLMDICEHTFEQAFQCAMITHTNGKCDVYQSSYKVILNKARALRSMGLSVDITQ
ncbi:MAG: ATP-dependent Clp protease adaptor ClpS [Bacteroidales bacterium]|jgi:ATP-dependent Clp protease adaptor protein ClpS|nr:ATP-dependent Clp protease adaptor ClpS [Bacteroidales bacterium]MBO7346723.1 ATP-dependent Clp protease adaptor ClpS [Bacteroidales bacterium]MBQ4478451.1 ATP-dependent Clp protease adaptor ClpS [Bacteroidales bacterium]MBR4454065.1 ATP-dependent Clp protease adaptor ClpS [Bacteroidales bacterium]MCR5554350.1 ATP-dependent Clp protease adaptor ClpS [Bacteroidales bacterium]